MKSKKKTATAQSLQPVAQGQGQQQQQLQQQQALNGQQSPVVLESNLYLPNTLSLGNAANLSFDLSNIAFGNFNFLQQLDALAPLIQLQNGLAINPPSATANQSNGPLPGTTTDNPLQSIMIGKADQNDAGFPTEGDDDEDGPTFGEADVDMRQATQPPVINTGLAATGLLNAGTKRNPATRRAPRGPRTTSDRSSNFRGVTKHKRSGRYESHIWVKDLGRQIYLGGYECEEHAAEAYDIAALKCKGRRVKTNFDLSKYEDLLGCIDRMSMEELVMAVRRQSQGFSRGTSSYRGVTKHPTERWEARIGIPGSKHIYLGLYSDEKDAAKMYDTALVRLKGRTAATNFALSDYASEMADYHRMQAKLLENDARYLEIQANAALFERWVKSGLEAFPDLALATPQDGATVTFNGVKVEIEAPTAT